MVRGKHPGRANLRVIALALALGFIHGGVALAQKDLRWRFLPRKQRPVQPPSDFALRVLELVNKERVKWGCRPLRMKSLLNDAAFEHSRDMARHHFMSHTGADGSQPGDRMTRAGYEWMKSAENIAAGYTSPESVVNGWMKSPGHRANILDCSFRDTGVGYVEVEDGSWRGDHHYWTEVFGIPR
ncbi:MAG: CAP domain-containing protein [Terriglobia bacterium]